MKKIILFLALFGFSLNTLADEVTHQLGNSGYAIREAMQAGAPRKSPASYFKALNLQRQAKKAFNDENLEMALKVSKEAETEAKQALAQSQS